MEDEKHSRRPSTYTDDPHIEKEGLKTYMFIFDDDGTMMACAVCAQAGEMLVCDQVTQLFKPSISNRGMDSTGKICQKNTIKVLSLYDGISTGYYCLTLLGFKIDSYYAFEIDVNAINVSKMNFSDKITHLGDVEKFTYDQISYLCPFDLVIGGSPCNDLSAVNPNRKGLYAHDGTGRLFFEYDRVLKAVQSLSPNPVFWLYENVASMPLAYRKTINRFLNCEPSLIDAKYFSAQRRPRFYWGNIPGMSTLAEVITEGSPSLSSAIMMSCKRVAAVDKLNTVTTQRNSLKPEETHLIRSKNLLRKVKTSESVRFLKSLLTFSAAFNSELAASPCLRTLDAGSSRNQLPVLMDGTLTSIWVTELEEVFGFPRHFTDVGNLGTQQRLSLLGKSWSTQVIVNIFHSLRHFFYTEPGVAL
ncbi:DNA (cytosine-5)-methyltransferase 3C-like [Hetaerina americana]|uniref:DNA (cytosine-5)-methyltransferase 3C-like n=1 Tax=Hetaerina americana TaxID=62018 RepID=UPI003A7F4BEE